MVSVDELSEIVTSLFRDMDVGHHQRINQRLSEAIDHVAELEPAVALAYLRTTYMLRNDLPAWFHLLDATMREFRARGLDAEKLCWGLYKTGE